MQSKALVNINQIAKDYGMSARQMNKILSEKRVQYKQGNQWLLYRKYHDKGYTSSETVNITRSDGYPDVISGHRKADCLFTICLKKTA